MLSNSGNISEKLRKNNKFSNVKKFSKAKKRLDTETKLSFEFILLKAEFL